MNNNKLIKEVETEDYEKKKSEWKRRYKNEIDGIKKCEKQFNIVKKMYETEMKNRKNDLEKLKKTKVEDIELLENIVFLDPIPYSTLPIPLQYQNFYDELARQGLRTYPSIPDLNP
jgi:hypothetical protein